MSLLKARSRLRAVKSLNSILSALQVVTVVRMKRVREKYAAAEGYLRPAKEVLAGRLVKQTLTRKVLVVITSNRGLCGNFNSQVIAKAAAFIKEHQAVSFVALGKRGLQFLGRFPGRTVLSESELIERPSYQGIAAFWQKLLGLNAEIYVAYNSYQSTAVQVPKIYRLYPVPEELDQTTLPADFILEPSQEELTSALVRHYLEARLFQLVIDSQMGELAARLMVLKSAVDNSKDLISNLVISINKMRQAAITRDLAEIIGSAEALRSAR